MTIEDIDWILRFPSDELMMSQETWNQLQVAISTSPRFTGVKVETSKHLDENQRQVTQPHKLADRKLTINQWITAGNIEIRVKGETKVTVSFA